MNRKLLVTLIALALVAPLNAQENKNLGKKITKAYNDVFRPQYAKQQKKTAYTQEELNKNLTAMDAKVAEGNKPYVATFTVDSPAAIAKIDESIITKTHRFKERNAQMRQDAAKIDAKFGIKNNPSKLHPNDFATTEKYISARTKEIKAEAAVISAKYNIAQSAPTAKPSDFKTPEEYYLNKRKERDAHAAEMAKKYGIKAFEKKEEKPADFGSYPTLAERKAQRRADDAKIQKAFFKKSDKQIEIEYINQDIKDEVRGLIADLNEDVQVLQSNYYKNASEENIAALHTTLKHTKGYMQIYREGNLPKNNAEEANAALSSIREVKSLLPTNKDQFFKSSSAFQNKYAPQGV